MELINPNLQTQNFFKTIKEKIANSKIENLNINRLLTETTKIKFNSQLNKIYSPVAYQSSNNSSQNIFINQLDTLIPNINNFSPNYHNIQKDQKINTAKEDNLILPNMFNNNEARRKYSDNLNLFNNLEFYKQFENNINTDLFMENFYKNEFNKKGKKQRVKNHESLEWYLMHKKNNIQKNKFNLFNIKKNNQQQPIIMFDLNFFAGLGQRVNNILLNQNIYTKTESNRFEKNERIKEKIIHENSFTNNNKYSKSVNKKPNFKQNLNLKDESFEEFSYNTINKDISKTTINSLNQTNKKIHKKKLIGFDVLSKSGRERGREKVNQDCFLVVPNINECENVKIFGVFDGHGEYGEIISKEIRGYFKEYFCNENLYKLNNKTLEVNEKKEKDINFIEKNNNLNNVEKKENDIQNLTKSESKKIKFIKLNSNKSKNKKNFIPFLDNKLNKKFHGKKFTFNQLNSKNSKLFNINNFSNNKTTLTINQNSHKKLINIYEKLSTNNYSNIYHSFELINKKLHNKYLKSGLCNGCGAALSLIFSFNSYNNTPKKFLNFNQQNYINKLITINLGDTKSILITENKLIKELNTVHTPLEKNERLRIENNGGVISRLDCSLLGPLRVWYKNKKTPGLSITRSFGDFDAEPLGIISVPDIKEYDIDDEKIKIVVIGTNAIFEFLTNEKIMDIILPYYDSNDCNGAVQKIKEITWKLWEIKNPKGIPDITVIVLFYK